MRRSHLRHNLHASLYAFALLWLSTTASGSDRVTLTGAVEPISCTASCGTCCGSYLLQDASKQIKLGVGKSLVNLPGLGGPDNLHKFTGSFYETTGQCGIGQCTLFMIEEVDAISDRQAVYNPDTDELEIPIATIAGEDEHYALTLKGPFNIQSITSIGKNAFALQGQSCAEEGAQCDNGLSCVSYYGIAGPSRPEFKTCEIQCSTSGSTNQCPTGQSCVTVADGPGLVCQTIP